MKKLLLWALAIAIILLDLIVFFSNFSALGNLILDNGKEKIVTKIIDGDTIIVEGGETIRLLGIDCDEKGRACYDPAKKQIDKLLLNKKVILESDGQDTDIYKRKLRYIFLDGENINKKMVFDGFCVARFPDESGKYRSEIIKAEQTAINNKIGCKWS